MTLRSARFSRPLYSISFSSLKRILASAADTIEEVSFTVLHPEYEKPVDRAATVLTAPRGTGMHERSRARIAIIMSALSVEGYDQLVKKKASD
jgi:hypothetical protein